MKKPLENNTSFAAFLNSLSEFSGLEEGAKPLDLLSWQPKHCGDIGLKISKDGSWWQNGVRFTREKLVRLFAGIMRKEDDGRTYLVTPVEKVIIAVEDAHFIAIRCDIFEKGENQKITFTTNVGDKLVLGHDCDLVFETSPISHEKRPYLTMRYGLRALLSRPVYYELVENSVAVGEMHSVSSNNKFYGLE